MDVLEKNHEKNLLKKLLIRRRNQRDQLMYQFTDARDKSQDQIEKTREQQEAKPAAESKQGADPVWSARTQEIKNRMTDKKRDAKDRWNRFAGTEDGGGRGL